MIARMRTVVLLALWALTGCGAPDASGPESAPAPTTPALKCDGMGHDGSHRYLALVDRDDAGRYVHTLLQRTLGSSAPETLGDFTYFEDQTPAQPTDVRVLYVFSLKDKPLGSFAVTLMEGGFTNQATTKIERLDARARTAMADLTCIRS